MDSFTFTVGKLDAGMAILIGERAHLIEFPSLLLPPGATSGSIVNIAVHRNTAEERRQKREFWDLQDRILETFGVETPKPPQLQVRNVTQTSVTLEWPPLHLATATLRSLDMYRNGERLATIPSPLQNTSTKLSGLEQKSPYTFQLILRTTAGTFPSNVVKLTTHSMTDTSGISVCFGTVQDTALLENVKLALQEMKAKWSDKVQIDTTHFVCTTPATTPQGAKATGGLSGGPGVEYQKALQASIPIVLPQWILACHQTEKMMPISQFNLGSSPPAGLSRFSPQSTPASSNRDAKAANRDSQDAHSVGKASTPRISTQESAMTPPSHEDLQDGAITPTTPDGHSIRTGKPSRRRQGTMQRDFRFPSPTPGEGEEVPASLPEEALEQPRRSANPTPVPVELPPPAPLQKEKPRGVVSPSLEGDEDVGETEEVDLT